VVSIVGALHEAPAQRASDFCNNSGRIRRKYCEFAHYLQKIMFFSAGRFVKRPYGRNGLFSQSLLFFTGIPVFRQGLCCIFNAARLCLSARKNFACPRGKMAGLQIAVFPVNAVSIPVGAL